MQEHGSRAEDNFKQGCNCAQSVLLSFCDDLNLEKDTALKLASSFGGGMGRLREVCGALTGLFMAIGIRYGSTDPGNHDQKTEQYERIQQLATVFRERYGSILCRDLLQLDEEISDPTPDKRTQSYYERRPCAEYVRYAASLFDQYEQGRLNQSADDRVSKSNS